MRAVWQKLKTPRKKPGKKAKATLAISAAHSSRLALMQNEGESDDESSFINDSPTQTPEPSDHEDDELEPSGPIDDDELPHDTIYRAPSSLEYLPGSENWRNADIDNDVPAPSEPGEEVPAPMDTDTGFAMTQMAEMRQPGAATHRVSALAQTHLASASSPSPSHPSPQPVAPPPPESPDPIAAGSRRSGRKRKERDELKGLAAALEACICGSSATPADETEYPNVARCKNEGCETKWYHLKCLEMGSVPEGWVCQACLSGDGGRSKRRRIAKK
ncbi:hypothetical protein B0H14DRAFT_3474643 [Mycena olivaceomarginata]|nr:hypothetical protein B0H14DRAFT_3474643 [Mycena olivaceomarginata]